MTPLPQQTYPAYGTGIFATAIPQPGMRTLTHLFESDDGLWYQALEVEIGYSMIREHEPIDGKWRWVYSYEPRVLRIEKIIDGPNGYGDNMTTRTPKPDEARQWLSRAEWILKTNFREVDAAIRASIS